MSFGIVKSTSRKMRPINDMYLRALKDSKSISQTNQSTNSRLNKKTQTDNQINTDLLKLQFRAGDVLFVVAQEDPHWWQAVRLESIKDGIS